MAATAQEELEMIARLVDETAAPFRKIQERMKKTETTGKKVSSGISKSFAKFGNVLKSKVLGSLAAVTAAVVGLSALRGATQMAIEFSNAMSEVATIVDSSVANMAELTSGVRDIAVEFGQAEAIVGRGLYQAISAGAEAGAESLDVLRTSAKLAVAGVTDINTAVKLVSGATNAYRNDNLKAAEASDIFFKTVKLGVTTIPELAGSIGRVLPQAQELGISLGEVSSIVATLTKSFPSTAEAVTALRGIFNTFLRPTDQAREAMDKYGISLDRAGLEAKGILGIFDDLARVAAKDKDAIAELFTESEALTGVFALLSDEGKLLTETMFEMENAAGAMQDAFNTRLADPAFRAQAIINAFKIGMTELGEVFLVELVGPLEGTENLFQRVRQAAQRFEPIARAILWLIEKLGKSVAALNVVLAASHSLWANISRLWGGTTRDELEAINQTARNAVDVYNDLAAAWDSSASSLTKMSDAWRAWDESSERSMRFRTGRMTEAEEAALSRRTGPVGIGESFDPSVFGLSIDDLGLIRARYESGVQEAMDATFVTFRKERSKAAREIHEESGSDPKEGFFGAVFGPIKDSVGKVAQGMVAATKKFADLARNYRTEIGLIRTGIAGIADGFADWITGVATAKEAFRDFAQSFLHGIARMMAEAIQLQLAIRALNWIQPGLGSVLAGASAGLDRGGVIGGPNVLKAARGMVPPPGRQTVQIQEGAFNREAVLPLTETTMGGRRVLGVAGGGGGGGTVNNYYIQAVDGPSFVQLLSAHAATVSRLVVSETESSPSVKRGLGLRGTVQ